MKEKMTLFQQFQRIKLSSIILLIAIFYSPIIGWGQDSFCKDSRQFYTKFLGQDTSVFITQDMFEHTPGLYSMSSAVNSNEIDCNTASFKFILMRKDVVLYSRQYDTATLKTLDSLRQDIKQYKITQGDILIFTNIRVKHYSNIHKRYCYHTSLPMLKVIDNFKTYPRRMYMDVNRRNSEIK